MHAGDRREGSGSLEFAPTLTAAQAGADWALSILYQTHNPPLLRYLRAKAGADGDDLASQTWIDAARNLSSFDGDADAFSGWMFTIARRRLADHHRRLGRRHEQPLDESALEVESGPDDPAVTTIEAFAGDEAARRIVELLPRRQAEVVLLRVLAGLSVAEVAEITGHRPGTVRVIQHRALRRLAMALGDDL